VRHRALRTAGYLIARATELALGGLSLGYLFFGDDKESSQARFLIVWCLVAFTYLTVGLIVVRRLRRTDPHVPQEFTEGRRTSDLARRISFFLSMVASLTGLNAALSVLADIGDDDYGLVVRGLGVITMIFAWMLLHVGYARFYKYFSQWHFPDCPYPGPVDFLYFSFTVGVSFAASDVEVRGRALRWHVMVHAVFSFFYNAIVLAVAVSIITGK
jgi:uncharacterized membrane protein